MRMTMASEPGTGASAEAAHRMDSGIVHDWTALALSASPQAARHFRRHAVSAARRWGLHTESGETVEACVSELVTNAIVHGVGRDVLMMLYFTGDSVLTEVFGHALDEPAIPVTARSDNAESGRGLLIVESLAKDWGSEHTGLGLLRVWASIAVLGGADTDTDTDTGT
jgi:anti-sigma regulatory factor (Ser/Thr protein kinase)